MHTGNKHLTHPVYQGKRAHSPHHLPILHHRYPVPLAGASSYFSSNSIASPWAPLGTEPNQGGPYCVLETLKTQVNYLTLIRAFYHLTVATEPELSSALRPPRLLPKTGAPTARRCHMSPGTGASHSRCYRLQRWPDRDSNTPEVNLWVLASLQGPAVLSAVNDTGLLEGLGKGLEFQTRLLPTPIQA